MKRVFLAIAALFAVQQIGAERTSYLQDALAQAKSAFSTYRRANVVPEDYGNLIQYLRYYQDATPTWNFTVTPPQINLSTAARNFVQAIRDIAQENNFTTRGGIAGQVTATDAQKFYDSILLMLESQYFAKPQEAQIVTTPAFKPNEQFYQALNLVQNALQNYANSNPSEQDYRNLVHYLSYFRSWYQAVKPAPQELRESLSEDAKKFIEQMKEIVKPLERPTIAGMAGQSRLSEAGVQLYEATLSILKSERMQQAITSPVEEASEVVALPAMQPAGLTREQLEQQARSAMPAFSGETPGVRTLAVQRPMVSKIPTNPIDPGFRREGERGWRADPYPPQPPMARFETQKAKLF